MKYDMQAINLEKTRIGSPKFDALLVVGWRLLDRLIPVEYNADGTVYTNYWIMYKDPIISNGGTIDLTEVWETIGDLGLSQDALNTLVTNVQLRVAALEQFPPGNGAGDVPPFEFEFDVWTASEHFCLPLAEGGITGKLGIVDGDRLCARFSVDNAALIPTKATLYIVPQAEVQPSGYAPFFPGMFVHDCPKHGWMLNGVARWHRRDQFGGGKQGIRMQYSNFSLVREINYPRDKDGHELHNVVLPSWAPGGDWYAMRRSEVLTTFSGDTFEVEVQSPRF